MQIQYILLGYGIDIYFCDHKFEIEIDENGHIGRNLGY